MNKQAETVDSVVLPSGYGTTQDFWAAKYTQGGRPVYVFDLSLYQVVMTLPKPNVNLDPEEALKAGNRQIKLAHAQGFADYIRANEHWVSPAVLLRAPAGVFSFEPDPRIGGMVESVSWGTLRIPKLSMSEIRILDGQHRTLGLHLAWDQIADDLAKARESLERAQRNGDPAGVIELAQADIRKYEDQRARMGAERLTLQVVVVTARDEYLQMFADIAVNARGIGKALQTAFDSSKVINRCVEPVAQHRLLRERVDFASDTVRGSSPNLMSARHVAELTRRVVKGSGNWTRADEVDRSEGAIVRATTQFLDDLISAYPELDGLIEGSLTPQALRDTSLLGSVTMLDVLARAYHDLLEGDVRKSGRPALTREVVVRGLAELPMKSPIDLDGLWVESGQFQEPWRAPLARGGNRKQLTDFVVRRVAANAELKVDEDDA